MTWLNRMFRGRLARRLYLGLFLLPVIFTTVVRIHAIFLTRRINAVLRGLEQLRVDQTTEEELLKTVPYVSLNGDRRFGSRVERSYRVEISNGPERRWLWWLERTRLFRFFWPWYAVGPETYPRTYVNLPLRVAYWLGWRDVFFVAQVTFEDATLSNIWYAIEPDVERVGGPVRYFVTVRAIEGFPADLPFPMTVSSTHDESPAYRLGGSETSFGVTYLPDAPRGIVSHAFQLDLSCYWDMRGCASARQVAPLLWRDTQAIETRTFSRLHDPGNPCPDRILAGRVRYLPDLNVELLEVTGSRQEPVNEKEYGGNALITDYRVKEVLQGRSGGPWSGIRYQRFVESPFWPTEPIANPVPPFKVGDKVLAFSGAKFDSCQLVLATPSAESAVRTAVLAKRGEGKF